MKHTLRKKKNKRNILELFLCRTNSGGIKDTSMETVKLVGMT